MKGEKLTVEEIVSRLRPIDDIFFINLLKKRVFAKRFCKQY